MSINIGTAAVNAIHELRGNHHFEELVAQVGVLAQARFISAANEADSRTTTAYAKALYDLWSAMHSAYQGIHPSQVKSPPLGNANARAREREHV